ncbi:unnamed protein product, partial [Cyprideis torosa]
MLEGLVAWVLNNYLGRYVENLNTDQLSVGLLQGAVQLENLPLRPDALRHFDLPFRIKRGYIGKVRLEIPISAVGSSPWIITLEQLYIIVTPIRPEELDPEEEHQFAHEKKLSLLEGTEAIWRGKQESRQVEGSLYASSYSSWLSVGASLATNIIENLQLRVRQIHFRYEDDFSIPSTPFAFGITLDSLSAQSCDANWIAKFVTRTAGQSLFYKYFELSKLAVYWRLHCPFLGDKPTGEVFVNLDKISQDLKLNDVVFGPVSAEAKVQRNLSPHPLRSSSTPRLQVRLEMEEINLNLSDSQFRSIFAVSAALKTLGLYKRNCRWRPKVPVKGNAKLWWKFAVDANLERWKETKEKRKWAFVLSRSKEVVDYYRAYRLHLLDPTAVPSTLKEVKDSVETHWNYDEIAALREFVMDDVERELKDEKAEGPGGGLLQSLFPYWGGWYSGSSAAERQEAASKLEESVLESIEDTLENSTYFKRDSVFLRLHFSLKRVRVALLSSSFTTSVSALGTKTTTQATTPLGELDLDSTELSIESRPRIRAFQVHLKLHSLHVRDLLSKDTTFPYLVAPSAKFGFKGRSGVSFPVEQNSCNLETPFLDFSYEVKPQENSWLKRVHMNSGSLDIVYNPYFMAAIKSYFSLPAEDQSSYHFTRKAHQTYEAWKAQTKEELFDVSKRRMELTVPVNWKVNVNVLAPQILIPEHFVNDNSLILVLDLGKCLLYSGSQPPSQGCVSPSSPTVELDSDNELEEGRRYTLELRDLQVLVGRAKDNWRYELTKGYSALHILDRFSVSIEVGKLQSNSFSSEIPRLSLTGSVEQLNLQLNEGKIQALAILRSSLRKHSQIRPQDCTPSTREEIHVSEDGDGETDTNDKASSQDEKKLFALLSIRKLSILIQSRERAVAEIRLGGLNFQYLLKAFESTAELSLDSLLVADMMQTFGPDFELLVACHRNVFIDSISGSLRDDSEPGSPASPRATSPSPRVSGRMSSRPLLFATRSCPGFLDPTKRRLSTSSSGVFAKEDSLITCQLSVVPEDSTTKTSLIWGNQMELAFNFSRVSVLFMRLKSFPHQPPVGIKVATADACGAEIKVNLGSTVAVEGSLGGLHLLDLTSSSSWERSLKILSVGYDPVVEASLDILTQLNKRVAEESVSAQAALNFNVLILLNNTSSALKPENGDVEISFTVASVVYTHSVPFLRELTECAKDVRAHARALAKYMTVAAAEVALELLQKSFAVIHAAELYASNEESIPILHDTVLDICVRNRLGGFDTSNGSPVVEVKGSVVDPLRVSLSKCQYQQILKTVDYLTEDTDSKEEMDLPKSTVPPLPSPAEVAEAPLSSLTPPVQGSPLRESLVMEDLSQPVGSPRRTILSSDDPLVTSSTPRPQTQRSRSFPLIPGVKSDVEDQDILATSLPTHLGIGPMQTEDVSARESLGPSIFITSDRSSQETQTHLYLPRTPPPSPRREQRQVHELVKIKIRSIDKKSPLFANKYDSINRFVDIDFNHLNVRVNHFSWIMVFDFFGISAATIPVVEEVVPPPDPPFLIESPLSTSFSGAQISTPSICFVAEDQTDYHLPYRNLFDDDQAKINTSNDVHVSSLTFILDQDEGEVAKVSIQSFSSEILSRDGNLRIIGSLGRLSVCDLSLYGSLYRERFVTTGGAALNFEFFKYGTPDPELRRPFDGTLRMTMSSILYVHTHRFIDTILNFGYNFLDLQKILGKLRAGATGSEILDIDLHGMRLKLDLDIESPSLVLPLSWVNSEAMIADLGKITVTNEFRMVKGEPGPPCLVDFIDITLNNMDLRPGFRVAAESRSRRLGARFLSFGSYSVRYGDLSYFKERPQIKVELERNLDKAHNHSVPDMSISAVLSMFVSMDVQQYLLFRGFLNHNLGEKIVRATAQDLSGYSMDEAERNSENQTTISLRVSFDLRDVKMDIRWKHLPVGSSLARIHFLKSRLTYESHSDESKDIDLVSEEVLLYDLRYDGTFYVAKQHIGTRSFYLSSMSCASPLDAPANQKANVFSLILSPTNDPENMEQSLSEDNTLQAELHYRARKDAVNFTVLLNDLRLVGVLDFWKSFLDFWASKVPDPQTNDFSQKETTGAPASPPIAVEITAGVVSKRAPQLMVSQPPTELKINITRSELVLLEDCSAYDSNAAILKTIAVISYRPSFEKPLSCNFIRCELFSCLMGRENETALSIVEAVTFNLEVSPRRLSAQSLLDAVPPVDNFLEVTISQPLQIRLSYYDVIMFLRILKSIPKQAQDAVNDSSKSVTALISMGFSSEDCAKALDENSGNLDEAALWLTKHCSPVKTPEPVDAESGRRLFNSIEARLPSLVLCVIDDCRDVDVPLVEFSLSQLVIKQSMEGQGHFSGVLAVDYYNRGYSGWEPLMEPWRCAVGWGTENNVRSYDIRVESEETEVLNLNLTSTLIELFQLVKTNWTEDYALNQRDKERSRSVSQRPANSYILRRRTPFLPFELKNDTGSQLRFRIYESSKDTEWEEVEAGAHFSFGFPGHGRQGSVSNKRSQIIVEVDGWTATPPVAVEKVGTYFRMIKRVGDLPSTAPTRLVFAIAIEGPAKKVITVRSALLIRNNLGLSIEISMKGHQISGKALYCLELLLLSQPAGISSSSSPPLLPSDPKHKVAPSSEVAIPLSQVSCCMYVLPVTSSPEEQFAYCSEPLQWKNVPTVGTSGFFLLSCRGVKVSKPFRFCAQIRHQSFCYPNNSENIAGHIITIFSPFVLLNLLPYELVFHIRNTSERVYVPPGKEASVHDVNVDDYTSITFSVEQFTQTSELIICGRSNSYVGKIRLLDSANRILELQVKVLIRPNICIKLVVLAPFWLVNKTMLPLVFRQDDCAEEAAGQSEEHEMGRCISPLMFSLCDPDASPMLQARLGKGCHPNGEPVVYLLSVNISPRKGRYRDTLVVTFAPRYLLYNRSSYLLQIAQYCQTIETATAVQHHWIDVNPGSGQIAWHWPRLKSPQLLCLRLRNVPACHWSGGISIDTVDSFHVNIRDQDHTSHFIHVEIFLEGASYMVVFSDASTLPPPIRVDNISEVPIVFHQASVEEEYQKTTVRPGTKVPYAWDVRTYPMELQEIRVIAPGGDSAVCEVKSTGPKGKLSYENFIYIAFPGSAKSSNRPLVLDVEGPERRVVLRLKEHGRRSQLWCMTSDGSLIHEGSSPPKDPSGGEQMKYRMWVLDITDSAPLPSKYVPLMLRRPSPQRESTQHWHFTEDGRLQCQHRNFYVQPPNGVLGFVEGGEVVLGPTQPVVYSTHGIPKEQEIERQRLRPGSGLLSVEMILDGPSRVLVIKDARSNKSTEESRTASEAGERQSTSVSSVPLNVNLFLNGGMGLSVIAQNPAEELLYLSLRRIFFEFKNLPSKMDVNCTVLDFQVDCPSPDARCPVVFYVTPQTSADSTSALPALHFSVEKMGGASRKYNAELFQHLIVQIKNVTLNLEERTLFKILAFAGYDQSDAELEKTSEDALHEARIISHSSTSKQTVRYYFGVLKLALQQVRLSVFLSPQLRGRLRDIKRKTGLSLIQFEDAPIELTPYQCQHMYETPDFILASLRKHYSQDLGSQAAKILGATDFLGNPLGLISDVVEGLHDFTHEKSIVGLATNVAHGMANSTAKFTGFVSEAAAKMTFDSRHQERRRNIRSQVAMTSSDHMKAGIYGLMYGVAGGLTGIVTQPFQGFADAGVQGLVAGCGRGVVGVFTKPTAGLFDFAAGAASAVRDTSKRDTGKYITSRARSPRLVLGHSSLLQRYSKAQAEGQEFLYSLNKNELGEVFIEYIELASGEEDLRAMVTSEKLWILSFQAQKKPITLKLVVHYKQLVSCLALESGGDHSHCLELGIQENQWAPKETIRVRCDAISEARKVK